jgi:methylmalonyl-CoA mutase
MAIQLINTSELGWLTSENPLQGSYFVEHLTDLVETAVLEEFLKINDRGGVLGAMETQYQRGRIQDESLLYETRKHSGELPIIGVNTFLDPAKSENRLEAGELIRASKEDKERQIAGCQRFQQRHAGDAEAACLRLRGVAVNGGNLFEELMETVKVATLGQITHALYEVGGEYRRMV